MAMDEKQEKMWAMLCHIGAIVLGFIAPLVIWLVKKDESPLVNDQGKEALNFQITMTIAFIVAGMLMAVFIGLILMPVLAVFNLTMLIIAGIKANEGTKYRYPVNIRFIK